ncbi:MAG: hypothetical protein WC352_01230 [Candidatus Omnitrophota bacterium]|jgi:hypothetical protein
MNVAQKTILAVGALMILLMLLFPPFISEIPTAPVVKQSSGYHFILWKGRGMPTPYVYIPLLLTQIGVVVFVTGIAFILLFKNKS